MGRCLEIWLTADAPLTAALVTLGWNAAASGVAVEHVGLRSFGLYGGAFAPAAPVFPLDTGTADCLGSGCDTAYGSFDGVSVGVIAAGSYLIGSINFDTSGLLAGNHDILAFLRSGVDGVTDKKFVDSPVQLNSARITNEGGIQPPVPEPSTSALLALGIFALSFLGRTRR